MNELYVWSDVSIIANKTAVCFAPLLNSYQSEVKQNALQILNVMISLSLSLSLSHPSWWNFWSWSSVCVCVCVFECVSEQVHAEEKNVWN